MIWQKVNPHAPPQERIGRYFWCFWLAIWVAQIRPVRLIADDSLDVSWAQALGRFLVEGLKIGRDYDFTYGPLGYFATDVYEPALYWQKVFLWEVLWRLCACWFLARALWDGHTRTARAAVLGVLLVVPLNVDAFGFAIIGAVLSVLSKDARPSGTVRAMGFLVLASLALVKFTFTAGVAITAAALIVHTYRCAGARSAMRDAAFCLAGFLACWLSAGQGLANIVPWVSTSSAIASAFSEGQSRPSSILAIVIAVWAMGLAIGALVRRALVHPRRAEVTVVAGAIALVWFLAFKAGYVRGEDHTSNLLGFVLVGCLLLPRVRAWLVGVTMALALTGILVAPESGVGSPANFIAECPSRLVTHARDVVAPWIEHEELEDERVRRAARFDLPRIRARVGRDPVDVFDFHQGVAFLNGLNYVPRPVFQSHLACTAELQELDVRHYEGPHAPHWILFKLQTIDNRWPMMENALLLETILRYYRPVLSEHRELLMERRVEALPPAQRTSEVECNLGFGKEFVLPASQARARMLSLDIRATALGRLAQFLYRAPEITLRSVDEFGDVRTMRIVPGMMRTGVLVDPFVPSGDGWIAFLVGMPLPRVRSFSVVIPEGWSWMYDSTMGLKLEAVEGFAPPPDDALSRELNAFVFERMPDGVKFSRPPARYEYQAHDCYFVYAPSTMAWTIAPGKYVLLASFGLTADPNGDPSASRACFHVGVSQGTHQVDLMDRWLDLSQPDDRALQRVALKIEARSDGVLVLSTALPNDGMPKSAWCYWSEVRIVPIE